MAEKEINVETSVEISSEELKGFLEPFLEAVKPNIESHGSSTTRLCFINSDGQNVQVTMVKIIKCYSPTLDIKFN